MSIPKSFYKIMVNTYRIMIYVKISWNLQLLIFASACFTISA